MVGMAGDTVHVFERAGLGKAPFRVVGFERRTYQACPGAPVQVGGSCDYCSTGIIETYLIRGADGSRFKVGNVCVGKTGDKGLISEAKRAAARVKTAARHEREDARIAAAREALPGAWAELEKTPHPHGWHAKQGKTLADWVEWMLAHAGRAGATKAARVVEKAAKA